MELKSTPTRYGAVAIAVHWITALAILSMLISGTVAVNTADDLGKTGILRVHAIVGATILALTLFRIGWWWLADRKPRPVEGLPKVQSEASKWVHRAFYLLILAMASSGIATLVLSGANHVIFGGTVGPLPDFEGLVPRTVHGVISRVLLLALAGHIGAALYHQFIRHDHLLARMGIGR